MQVMQAGPFTVNVLSKCHVEAVVRTSKTHRNPNRLFWSCPNYKSPFGKWCDYFEWCDLRILQDIELYKQRIVKLVQRVAILEEDNHRLVNELQTQGDNGHSQQQSNTGTHDCFVTVDVDVVRGESSAVATMISRLTIN
ncbi:unnamed protein product [Linum trigynum]|uniref:GRF-type domain-containing protein n=1 Tax=Linum trigynum TaxID=586398 RepID=A0AAV2GAN2_9ROSI